MVKLSVVKFKLSDLVKPRTTIITAKEDAIKSEFNATNATVEDKFHINLLILKVKGFIEANDESIVNAMFIGEFDGFNNLFITGQR